MWSPQYQTFVVVTIGLLSVMFDEERLHRDVAPRLLDLSRIVGAILANAEGDVFQGRSSDRFMLSARNKMIRAENVNELEAGARRTRPARGLRAGDGRRRQGQAAT
jgi:hypothetical protein